MSALILYLFPLLMWNMATYDEKQEGQKVEFPANSSAVRYIGRTMEELDGTVSFDWVGTYLETGFTGNQLSIRASDTGNSYYNVFLDGKQHRVVKISGKDTLIALVTGVDKGHHILKLQKRSEGEFGKSSLHSFVLPSEECLFEVPRMHTRHIEFIGNSLTCGYGVEGKYSDGSFLLEEENCNLSFACIIARYFNADYTLIAHSGRGVVRNYGDSLRISRNTMKDKMLNRFDEYPIPWDFETFRPDLVVINLGSNDFSTKPFPFKRDFVDAYKQIIFQLRLYYGEKLPILCLYPSGIQALVYSYYETLVDELADPSVYLLKLQDGLYNGTTDLGAAWHPGISGHKKMAMNIIPYISTIMGWDLENKPIE